MRPFYLHLNALGCCDYKLTVDQYFLEFFAR